MQPVKNHGSETYSGDTDTPRGPVSLVSSLTQFFVTLYINSKCMSVSVAQNYEIVNGAAE